MRPTGKSRNAGREGLAATWAIGPREVEALHAGTKRRVVSGGTASRYALHFSGAWSAAARPRQRFALARWAWSAESFLRPAANAVAKACVRGGGTAKPCRRGCVRLSELGGLDPCKRPRQPGRRVRIGGFFRCLRRGTFHRGKVPKTRRGLRPPVPREAARRASPEKAFPRPLRSTGPSRPILPAPSRLRAGQWNRTIVTATELFSKAARTAQERGRIKHTAVSCAFYPFSP